MSLNSAGLRELREDEQASTTSAEAPLGVPVDPLESIRTEAGDRLSRELHNVRIALTVCYDEAVERLGSDQWVPLDLVTQLVNNLTRETATERERAAGLEEALNSIKGQVEDIRSECQAIIAATQAAAAQERKETAARFGQELNAARETARLAASAETEARRELSSVRSRCQEIVDAQMLQLVEFKRELGVGQKPQEAERVRSAANATALEASTRPPQPKIPAATFNPRAERSRNGVPAFDAIEAALADSPPLGKWPSRAAV